jgi:hypothetical protein
MTGNEFLFSPNSFASEIFSVFQRILKNLLIQTSLLFLPGIRTGDHASWRKPKPPLVCQAPKPETANSYADTY